MADYKPLVHSSLGFGLPQSTAVGAGNPRMMEKMAIARQSYMGDFKPSLKTRVGGPDDNVMINKCKTVVDKSVSYLFGKHVTFVTDKEATRSPHEKILDAIWARNNQGATLQKIGTNGAIYGQAFVKLHIEADSIRIMVLDPTTVTVFTSHYDYTEVNEYVIQWTVTTDVYSQAYRHYRQRITRIPSMMWTDEVGEVQETPQKWIVEDSFADSMGHGQPIKGDWIATQTEVWDFPFPPILEVQNLPTPNEYWGLSDIEPDVIHLNETLNRVSSNTNKIIRNHAHPKTIVWGLTDEQAKRVTVDSDSMLFIPGSKEDVDLKNLEMNSDLASSLNYFKSINEAFYEVSRTPEIASGKAQEVSYLSAMAMQILYGPMIEKTNSKQMTYGPFLSELNRRILIIMGVQTPDPVEIIWPVTFPRDAQTEVMTGMNKLQVGFSSDTVISELGGNPDYERERRKDDPGTLPSQPAEATQEARTPEIGKTN